MVAETFYEGTLHSDLIGKQTTDGVKLGDLWKEVNTLIGVINKRRLAVQEFLGYYTTKPDADKVTQASARWMRKAEHAAADVRLRIQRDIAVTTGLEAFESYLAWTEDAELLVLTSEEIRDRIQSIIEADEEHRYQQLLRQFYSNAPRTIVDEVTKLAVTTKPFYHGTAFGGDTDVPPRQGVYTFAANHNHFLTSTTTDVVTETDLDNLVKTVAEHGFTKDLFLICNEDMADKIMALTKAVPFLGISKYVPKDAVNINNENALMTYSLALNSLFRIVGVWKGKAHVLISDQCPLGYIGCFSHQGPGSQANPLQVREPNIAALRGLRIVSKSPWPFLETHFSRYYGVGVRQRGNGAVMKVASHSGTYAAPVWDDYNEI